MTARPHYHLEAGRWVAYRDEPNRRWDQKTKTYIEPPVDKPVRRIYLWNTDGVGSTQARDCVRFDTKAEAQAAARDRWPTRVRGCRVGAERVTPTCLTCGALTMWAEDAWTCTSDECGDEWHPDVKRYRP